MKVFFRMLLILALAPSLFAQSTGKSSDQTKSDQTKKDAEGQELHSASFYKLTFVLYELEDGKRVNQRDYAIIGKADSRSSPSIRLSTRIPVYSEEKKMQYIDAGLNLSCGLREQPDGKVEAQCEVNVSGFVRQDQVPEARGNGIAAMPILRSTYSNSWSVLTPGKPMLIASIDDINSTKRMQIELTAAKIE